MPKAGKDEISPGGRQRGMDGERAVEQDLSERGYHVVAREAHR